MTNFAGDKRKVIGSLQDTCNRLFPPPTKLHDHNEILFKVALNTKNTIPNVKETILFL